MTTSPAGPASTGPVPAGPAPAGPVPAGPVPAGPVPAGPAELRLGRVFAVRAGPGRAAPDGVSDPPPVSPAADRAGDPEIAAGHAPPAARLRSPPTPPTPPREPGRLRALVADRLRVVGGDLDPGRPGLRVLLAVALAAALLSGFYVWRSRPEFDVIPQAGRAEQAGAPTGGNARPELARPGADAAGPDATGAGTGVAPARPGSPAWPAPAVSGAPPAPLAGPQRPVVVHVVGQVRRPGVVTLQAGARVTDAVTAAGGTRPGARTDLLNLARVVVDGEQIVVGGPAGAANGAVPGPVAPPPAAIPGAVPGAVPGAETGLVDLNTATAEQLERLPGVGEVLAQRILTYRAGNGGFRAVEQLREIVGIGERTFAELRDRVRV